MLAPCEQLRLLQYRCLSTLSRRCGRLDNNMKAASRALVGWLVFTIVLILEVGSGLGAQDSGAAAATVAPPRRVYSRRLDPREHPDYDRRAVKPPTWETFKNRTQFTCLRGFGMKDDLLFGFAEEIEKFTRMHELGEVIWPSYSTLFATNLSDLADEIKHRDLYLFDIWGYVPGSGPGGYWTQFTPPASAFIALESKLGERWLGTEIGEQDGRYIGRQR